MSSGQRLELKCEDEDMIAMYNLSHPVTEILEVKPVL